MKMRTIRKKLKRKLHMTSGFSLGEMLLAVALLSLAGVMIAGGITVAIRAYRDMTRKENAETLYSTVTDRLRTEFRSASGVKPVDGTVVFKSSSKTALDGKMIAFKENTENGHILVHYYTASYQDTGSSDELFPDATYTDGLKVEFDSPITAADHLITYSIKVVSEDGKIIAGKDDGKQSIAY